MRGPRGVAPCRCAGGVAVALLAGTLLGKAHAGEFVALGTLPNGAVPNVIAIDRSGVLASGSPGWVRRRGESWVALPTLGVPGTATDIAGGSAFAARSSFENTLYTIAPGAPSWSPLGETRPRTGAGPLLNQEGSRLLQSITTASGDVMLTAWEAGSRSEVRVDAILRDTGSGQAWLAQENRPTNSEAGAFLTRPDGEFVVLPRPVASQPATYRFFPTGMSGSARFAVGEYEETSVPVVPRQAFVWEFGPGGGVSSLRPQWAAPLDVADNGLVLMSGGVWGFAQADPDSPGLSTIDLLTGRGLAIPSGWTGLIARWLSDDGSAIAGTGTREFAPGQSRTEWWVAYPCASIDFNADGVLPDIQDIVDFFAVFAGGSCPTAWCESIDFNNDGVFPDITDVVSFLNVFSGGACDG